MISDGSVSSIRTIAEINLRPTSDDYCGLAWFEIVCSLPVGGIARELVADFKEEELEKHEGSKADAERAPLRTAAYPCFYDPPKGGPERPRPSKFNASTRSGNTRPFLGT